MHKLLLALLLLASGAQASVTTNPGVVSPDSGVAVTSGTVITVINGEPITPETVVSTSVTSLGLVKHGTGVISDGPGTNAVTGNARGASAADLQVYRSAATQVASGAASTISGGQENTASGTASAIGGGSGNTAIGGRNTIGGGTGNSSSDESTTIAGGNGNTAAQDFSTVGGGAANAANGSRATVGGGVFNTASGGRSTVNGGDTNTASGTEAMVGGGVNNVASGNNSTVNGGNANVASGLGSAIPGGQSNEASGINSFAAGLRAKALHDGAFVWADGQDADFSSTRPNQFSVRVGSGTYFEAPSSTFTGTISAGSGTILVYRCTGSTAGVADGNMNAAGVATACPGGTYVLTSYKTN